MINWESTENHILLNPRLPENERERLLSFEEISKAFVGHIWITTSGSTSIPKWVGLSKQAFLSSAEAVNAHLQSGPSDVWINSLPDFHVGGLGIWARSYLTRSRVVDFKQQCPRWDPFQYREVINKENVTLGALVPAQVYDLVLHNLVAPKSLRAIIVGGGALEAGLRQRAGDLGWNMLPSYGLTECASQVATAPLVDEKILKTLDHVKVLIDEEGFIKIKSPALLTAYAVFSDKWQLIDPKKEGWFTTDDKGAFDGQSLVCLGRAGKFVKIGGESVNFQKLESLFEKLKLDLRIKQDMALILVKDERLGHVVHLVVAGGNPPEMWDLVDEYQNLVLPYEKIRNIDFVDKIPRSPLNKMLDLRP